MFEYYDWMIGSKWLPYRTADQTYGGHAGHDCIWCLRVLMREHLNHKRCRWYNMWNQYGIKTFTIRLTKVETFSDVDKWIFINENEYIHQSLYNTNIIDVRPTETEHSNYWKDGVKYEETNDSSKTLVIRLQKLDLNFVLEESDGESSQKAVTATGVTDPVNFRLEKLKLTFDLNLHTYKYSYEELNKIKTNIESFSNEQTNKDVGYNCHSTSKEVFGCEKCAEVFRSKSAFIDHIVKHGVPALPGVHQGRVTSELAFSLPTIQLNDCIRSSVEGKLSLLELGRPHDVTNYSRSKHCSESPLPALRVDRKEFICGVCSAVFSLKSNLKCHLRIHTGERPFACALCSAAFHTKCNLKNHERTHSAERPFKCSICSAAFRVRKYLKSHERIHSGLRPYLCHDCNASFVQKNNLRSHVKVHISGKRFPHPQRRFECHHCSTSFSKKHNLKVHMRTHTNECPFMCATCDRSFRLKVSFTNHVRLHTGERPFTCRFCSRSFRVRHNLTDHERTHTGEKPFKCSLCSAAFSQRSNLVAHERAHDGRSPFRCKWCPAVARTRSKLEEHCKTHTKVKPFRCDHCGKSFGLKSTLKNHIQVHMDARSFKCEWCSKAFRTRSAWVVHRRIHTGEKPFACDACGTAFSQKIVLQKHVKTHSARNREERLQ